MNTNTQRSELPDFDFNVPEGYYWLWERQLVSMQPFGPLQPWYYTGRGNSFEPTERWPSGPSRRQLVAFARRQDCDEIACFEVSGKEVSRIVLVHGWTTEGYEIEGTHSDFWSWVKGVIDDIAEWVSLGSEPGS